jgi:CRP-like cAMP-binding protein
MRWRLLAGVPEEEIQHVLSVARRRRFARNEVVFHRDDPGDSLHLIVKGRFAIRIANPRGETVMMGLRGPGDHFGEMALVAKDRPRAATLVALEDAETFAVSKAEFDRLRIQYPGVNDVLLWLLAGEVRLLDERFLETMYLSAEKRLLRRLCELAEFYPRADSATEVPLTQEQLAELAGTSRATVNRVLRDEEQRGTVELRRGKTIVRDVQSLAKRGR